MLSACAATEFVPPAPATLHNLNSPATPSIPSTPARTEIYYIAPTGSDATGTGTSASPWASLYKACRSVKTAGNVIHVNAGTYFETQQCNIAGGVSIEGDGITSVIKSHYLGDIKDNNDAFY